MEPDSLSIDVAIQSALWSEAANIKSEAWIASQLAPLLGRQDIRLGELSIALVDDAKMATLNKYYREKDGPTNVLSFPADAPLLGDIVLSYETIKREASDKGVSFADHMSHLLIHGFLHLQGYDHQTHEEAAVMEALEITALEKLHIDNPYENTRLD